MLLEGWFSELIGRLHELIGSKRGGADDSWWGALDDAVTAMAGCSDPIEGLGRDGLEELLRLVGVAGQTPWAAIAAIRAMDPDELIAAVEANTAALEADTAVRAKRMKDLETFLSTLGEIGCRVILGVLLAVA